MKHYVHEIFRRRFKLHLAGCGGTGTLLLNELARIHAALKALGHPGFDVTVFDPDHVSQANLGRQLFSVADIGRNKAEVMATRLNQFYGLGWEAEPCKLNRKIATQDNSFFLISAIDTVKDRLSFSKFKNNYLYWLDCGNTRNTGQVALGTGQSIIQPETKKAYGYLPSICDLYNLSQVHEDDQGPSCSLADALEKQDAMINRFVASLAMEIFWKMMRYGGLNIHGGFINLECIRMTPLPIDMKIWKRMGWNGNVHDKNFKKEI